MVAADGKPIAITSDDPNTEFRVGDLQSCGQSGCAAMDAVNPIRVHVVGETAGTTNARDEDDILFGNAQQRHRLLNLGQNAIIATTWTPAHGLVGYEIFAG